MCNLYEPAPREEVDARHLVKLPELPYGTYVAPLLPGPVVMARGQSAVGQWGMIPPDSKTRTPMTREGRRMSTNNARVEGMAKAWTYRFPWSRGQRCLIPAESFQEPYWGPHDAPFAKSIAWRFARADGQPWALAGLWSEWTDPATGKVVPNFTMLTQNCDGHPLLALMHKPERGTEKQILPLAEQDKRAVVPVEEKDWDQWLHGTLDQALQLIQLPAVEIFRHGAVDPDKQLDLPL